MFADDLVLLADSGTGLQCLLDGFAAACDNAGIISTAKTEVLHLSRNPGKFAQQLQVNGVKLKQVEKFNVWELYFLVMGNKMTKWTSELARLVQ